MALPEPFVNFKLTLHDDGKAEFTVEGPKVTVSNLDFNPAIGVARDRNGAYHFLFGTEKEVWTENQLGDELRKLLTSPPSTSSTLPLPSMPQLKNENGGFRTFHEYERNRRLLEEPLSLGPAMPKLTPKLYQTLIDSYQKGSGSGGGDQSSR